MMREAALVALVGVRVLGGDGPPIDDATVLLRGERIAAVGPHVTVPAEATVLPLHGAVVTAGLIDAASRLGVADIDLEASAVEATLESEERPVRAALRAGDTWNPASFALPVARAGGLVAALVRPTGGVISGQSVLIELGATPRVLRDPLALHVAIGGGEKPGSRTEGFLELREALEDARLFRANRGAYIRSELRALSPSAADLEVLVRALDGELPVVVEVDRATDMTRLLAIARDYDVRLIVLGGAEGWKVAAELARARVPVLVDPLANLPSSFDRLEARDDNAWLLHQAGVRVAFTAGGESHLAHRLRFLAGNAVSQGFTPEQALAAITRVPAELLGMRDQGVLRKGALATLVVWTGDPLEPLSWPTHVFVRGDPVALETRQDRLTERYRRLPETRPQPPAP